MSGVQLEQLELKFFLTKRFYVLLPKKIKVNIYQLVICRKIVVNEKTKSAKGQLTVLVVLGLSNFSHCCIRILAVFENNITRERVTACELNHIVNQWFSTRIPPVQSRGSARCYMNFHFILLIELNAVFLCKTIELLYRGSSSHWNVFLGFRSSKKVETTVMDE